MHHRCSAASASVALEPAKGERLPRSGAAQERTPGKYDPYAVRGSIVAAVFALAVAGCAGTAGDARDETGATSEAPASALSPVERCTERLLRTAEVDELSEPEKEGVRRYAERTYCAPFAERGWVYDDGTLSIEAHKWLEEGGQEECVSATEPGEPAKTVPCEQFDERGSQMIGDCALLLHVRRSEVRDYLEQLRRRHGDVECEDGTPLAELGAP